MELLAVTISATFLIFGLVGFIADHVFTYRDKRSNK